MTSLLRRLRRSPIVAFWSRFSAAGPGVLAAGVAYNVFFALVPLSLAVLSAASLLGRDEEALERVLRTTGVFAPEQVQAIIDTLLHDILRVVEGRQAPVIVGSMLVALWSGSRAVLALQRVLTRIEGLTDERPWWRVRLTALGLTVFGGLSFLVSTTLLVAGRALFTWLDGIVGWDALELWLSLRIPVGAAGLYLFLVALYRYGPPRPLPAGWFAALFATSLAVAASLGFQLYLERFTPQLGAVFGPLTAVAVALIWLYLGSLSIIVGASVAAEIWRWRERRRDRIAPDRPHELPHSQVEIAEELLGHDGESATVAPLRVVDGDASRRRGTA